jgi:hypothetical protein
MSRRAKPSAGLDFFVSFCIKAKRKEKHHLLNKEEKKISSTTPRKRRISATSCFELK